MPNTTEIPPPDRRTARSVTPHMASHSPHRPGLVGWLQAAGVLGHPQARPADVLLAAGLPLCFLFYFVVRGHITGALVGMFLLSVVVLAFDRSADRPHGPETARMACWLAIALALPFVAVGLTQLLHREWVPRHFDPMLRLMLSGVIFLCLLKRRINFLVLAQWCLPLALLLCAAAIFVYPHAADYYWDDGRLATYFMDPLTLSQHAVIVGFMCLFMVNMNGREPVLLKALQYGAFVAAIAISVGTKSRSGWILLPVLGLLWLVGLRRHRRPLELVLALSAVVALCLALYGWVPVVRDRVDLAALEIGQYFHGGDRDTSTGLRISMWRANWVLFLEQPWFGWGYTRPADLHAVPEIMAFLTPMFELWYTKHGGHNEFLSNMMQTGLPGLVSRLMVFGVPFVLFCSAIRSGTPRRRVAGYMGLALVLGYAIAGINTEVFNLVYTASFYGLMLAALAATALYPEAPDHDPATP